MTKLAIAIPTYCRADMLVENLRTMLTEATWLDVSFHISDDSPDDTTERALAPLTVEHDRIFYRRNDPALRHDRNLMGTLLWPDADYVWLLGDSFYVIPGQLGQIVEFLDEQDLVFVNSHANRMGTAHDVRGEAARELLRELLWHQTLTGATIYRRSVCDWVGAHGEQEFPVKAELPAVERDPRLCQCAPTGDRHVRTTKHRMRTRAENELLARLRLRCLRR